MKLINILNEIDNPKKADYVTSDVTDFFDTLDNISKSGGLKQQTRGSMSYQKSVETLQIALKLLGYDLPIHGVDGLFGPETAKAVNDFKNDNNLNESVSLLRSVINDLGYDEKGNELTSGGNISDDITKIVSEILIDFKKINNNCDVVVTAGNDKFHQNRKSLHKEGKAIDVTLNPYNQSNENDFISVLNKFKSKYNGFDFINEYKNPSKGSTGGHFHLQFGDGTKTQTKLSNLAFADSLTIDKIINLLKQKNIKSTDLKPNIDSTTEYDVTTKEGFDKYVEICQKFIDKKVNPLNISGEMLANGALYGYKNTGRIVPPQLALAQLTIEGGIGNKNLNSRPIRTKNPFNIGNTSTKSKSFQSIQDAINAYFLLIGKNYLGTEKNPNDLLNNFVNLKNQRYAYENQNYENMLKQIISKIQA